MAQLMSSKATAARCLYEGAPLRASKIGHQFMHTIPGLSVQTANGASPIALTLALPDESRSERVERLYQDKGGPLMGWLFDEWS